MSLKDQKLKFRYRTGKDNLIKDFFTPCLSTAVLYQRAVGFFSASSLISLSRGLISLLKNGGKIELIASPHLSSKDIEAIQKGYDKREVLLHSCEREINELQYMTEWDSGIEALAWLIENQRLEIKIACRKLNHELQGIYHEKLGVIHDEESNFVTFTGSINESTTALATNFESFDVDMSWNDVKGLGHEKAQEFKELWFNQTNGVEIYDFTEALNKDLLKLRKFDTEDAFLRHLEYGNESSSVLSESECSREYTRTPTIPCHIELRKYQKEAIQSWFDHNGRGVFKMGTGTGKTITALSSSVKLLEFYKKLDKSLTIIVICPYKHLVTQWSEECYLFGIQHMLCFDSRSKWLDKANQQVLSVNMAKVDYKCFLTTNTTFSLEAFQSVISKIKTDILLIADEAHNLGSKKQLDALPEKAKYRLALSATPERWFDDEGTEALFSYFGKPVIEFGLRDALESGFLTPYYYYPHLIHFTLEEGEEYLDISKRIGRALGKKELTKEDRDNLQKLQLKRARLCSSAENKTKRLFELMNDVKDQSNILIYCGDGRVEGDGEFGKSERQIEFVVKKLGFDMGMKVHSFTSQESMKERKQLSERFGTGELQALVAIRCLDEGVDIPATKTAFIIASSTNPRQFIQRRGRVLRKAKGKEFAVIHDFIMIPPTWGESDSYNTERSLFKKELMRISEFAQLAKNGGEAMMSLQSLREYYGLLHI